MEYRHKYVLPWTLYEHVRHGRLTVCPIADEIGSDKDVFFNDLNALVEEDQPIAIRLTISDTVIDSVTTYYSNGKACVHSTFATGVTGRIDSLIFIDSPIVPIQCVVVQGGKLSARSVVNSITFGLTSNSKDFTANKRDTSDPRPIIQRPPSGAWDFRGFWGYQITGGFTKLGAIWNLRRQVTVPSPPPLFELGALATICPSLQSQFKSDPVGGYIRFGKCAGDPARTFSKNPVPYIGGANFGMRGSMPRLLTFYLLADFVRAVTVWYPITGDFVLPAPDNRVDTHDGMPTTLNMGDKSVLASINQVTIWDKPNPNNNNARMVTYVQIDMTGKDPFVVGKTKPGSDATATVCPRPAPINGKQWLFGGFYAAGGILVDNMGVVWIRDDNYLA